MGSPDDLCQLTRLDVLNRNVDRDRTDAHTHVRYAAVVVLARLCGLIAVQLVGTERQHANQIEFGWRAGIVDSIGLPRVKGRLILEVGAG